MRQDTTGPHSILWEVSQVGTWPWGIWVCYIYIHLYTMSTINLSEKLGRSKFTSKLHNLHRSESTCISTFFGGEEARSWWDGRAQWNHQPTHVQIISPAPKIRKKKLCSFEWNMLLAYPLVIQHALPEIAAMNFHEFPTSQRAMFDIKHGWLEHEFPSYKPQFIGYNLTKTIHL